MSLVKTMFKTRPVIIIMIVIAFVSALLLFASPASVQRFESRSGFDPLSDDEIAEVLSIAQPTSRLSRASAPQSATDAPAQETLLVERHVESKEVIASGDWERRSDVFVYDYGTDSLIHTIVNLETGAADFVETLQGVQLPLNENERARAIALLFADAEGLSALSADYEAITGQTLSNPSQIEIRTFAFDAATIIDADLGDAAVCGIQRCTQLLIYTPDSYALNLLPVINLSQGTVASLLPFGQ